MKMLRPRALIFRSKMRQSIPMDLACIGPLVSCVMFRVKRGLVGESDFPKGLEIALHEALTNVVRHGCIDPLAENGNIIVTVNHGERGRIWVWVHDNGREYVPPSRDVKLICADNLPESGFGWPLITQVATSYRLRRMAGRNHLLLVFDRP